MVCGERIVSVASLGHKGKYHNLIWLRKKREYLLAHTAGKIQGYYLQAHLDPEVLMLLSGLVSQSLGLLCPELALFLASLSSYDGRKF